MRRWPFHPVLFAAFPVLFLFAQNVQHVRFGKTVQPLVVVVAGAIVVTGVAFAVFRDFRRAGIVASGCVLLALSYGHVWTALEGKAIAGVVVGRDMVLLPLWIAIGIGVVLFAWRLRVLEEVTGILNAVGVGLLALSLFNTGTALAAQRGPVVATPGKESRPIPTGSGEGTTRDIYYLIFDRYGGSGGMRDAFGFDNGPFLDELRKRGFYVADQSVSNYPKTAHSLATSMNMEYLDRLTEDPGRDSADWKPVHRLLVAPKITRFAQDNGYSYAHIGSWWDPTASDPTAQLNYHYDKRSEFTSVFLQTTIVRPIAKRVGLLAELDGRRVARNQIKFQFDAVRDAAKLDGPTFVFAHFLLPHPPFTFDRNGGYVTEEQEKARGHDLGYTDQVQYANSRIVPLVDHLLDAPPDEQPIVIIQADEGPHPWATDYGRKVSWKRAPDDVLEVKFPIMNAYFFPGVRDHGLYPTITPANTFRRLLNLYFGTDLKPLPDESYIFGDQKTPYDFESVTDRIKP